MSLPPPAAQAPASLSPSLETVAPRKATAENQAQTQGSPIRELSPRPVKRKQKKRLGPQVQKWIRRTHMYSGIALFPWVVMYGLTAMLFNHSSWMSTTVVQPVGAADMSNAGLGDLPPAEEYARAAIAQLVEREGDEGPRIALVPGSAQFLGSLSYSASNQDHSLRLTVHPEGKGGRIRATERSSEDSATLPGDLDDSRLEFLAPDGAPSKDELEAAGGRLAAGLGWELEKQPSLRTPAVRFRMAVDNEIVHGEANLDGRFAAQRESFTRTLRSRLLRLHLMHIDPGYSGIRQLWALLVDLMGIAMIFWGLSGLIMWWAIKKTRPAGTVALFSGLGAMVVMSLFVWEATGVG